MDLYEFNQKTLNEKTQLVWDRGTFLTLRFEAANFILLYHLDKFFAEVWYDHKQNQIVKVGAFKSRRCLEPYLDLVDLAKMNG